MKKCFILLSLICAWALPSCESKRTIYDSSGNVVEDRKDGESVSLEERFAGGFDTKKNEYGIAEAESKKVSSFQGKIDDSRNKADAYKSKSFAGGKNASTSTDMSYRGATARFAGAKTYGDAAKVAYTSDDVPDFMKEGKGITRKEYAGGKTDVADSSKRYDVGEAYQATVSSSSTQQESGYVESRRESSPTFKIYSKDEYQRKTIEDTRSMLRRDNAMYGGQ